jgi:hypothetical protein
LPRAPRCQAPHVRRPFDLGELPGIAIYQVGDIGLEQASAAASVGAPHRFRVSATQSAFEVVVASASSACVMPSGLMNSSSSISPTV